MFLFVQRWIRPSRWKIAPLALFVPLSASAADPPPPIRLRDIAPASPFPARAFDPARGRHDLTEIMGGGLALIDEDGDGDLDLFLTDRSDVPSRLFRNKGDGAFEPTDVKFHAPTYPMGAAVGDYDGDGKDDLFVTGWGDQRLYRNIGTGFEDVTERAGLTSMLWTTSAAWADLDGDGDLDLYVAAYLDYRAASAPYCAAPDGRRDYCAPEDFTAQPDRLYRNNGDGTFTDVSRSAGVDLPNGRGLGVVVADLVGDSRPDVFVANDGTACWLFENLGGLRFREVALQAGVALDGDGQPLAGMGAAVGDLDGDGLTDLVVTNLHDRTTVAFQARGGGQFQDVSTSLGLRAATRRVTGFGLALVDLDADGRLDLVQANGHVLDRQRLGVPFRMPVTLLRNDGRFVPVDSPSPPILGRGLAVGDLDADGRPDLVVNPLDFPPLVLHNESPARSVAVSLVGRCCQSFGARLRATVGGRTFVRDLPGGGSYLSGSGRHLYLSVDDARRIGRVEVTWPSGAREAWEDVEVKSTLRFVEGSGRAVRE